ncbi:MAG: 50S ribosomal protein L18 [Chloroflexi bacterium]|nr:50S ribosomal protein L18 [Chloroflexota bacterium]
MFKVVSSKLEREKRHRRIQRKIRGSADRPRLNVFRSLNHVYAQLVDDDAGRTLVAVSTLSPELRGQLDNSKKADQATMVGRMLAEKARGMGVSRVVFDRGGYKYHGRVKMLAEAAREGGLVF